MLVFLMIVLVSDTVLLVKLLLAIIAILFLFPFFRRILLKGRMRKVKVAFLTSVLFAAGFYLDVYIQSGRMDHVPVSSFFTDFFLFLLISLIGNFLYGLPVSVLAEFVSTKSSSWRFWISGGIHLGFGAIVLAPIGFICSIIFFSLDELMRKRPDGI